MNGALRKILFISHDASRTGAPIALLNLIKWIRANSDLDFRILLRAGGPLEPDFRALGETHVLNDANGNPAFVRDVTLIFSNTCTNSHFIETLPYGTIPVVTHVHEMEAIIESYGPENLRAVKRQTTQFIACSQAVSDGLVRLDVGREKISTIHGSIPIAEVQTKAHEKTKEQIKTWHGWESYEHIVAACGVADWRKGADLFVQVAQAVKRKLSDRKKVLFLWVGILPPDERGKLLTNDIRQLDLDDTVQFLGEQSNPHPYLRAADLFCLPSREDPFPLVMLEAAALGKPIVSFQHSGGAEEFCQRGGGMAVPFLDVDAMSNAIIQLVEQEDLRKKFGTTAARLVAEHFDFSVNGPRFLCAIEKYGRNNSSPALGYAQVYFPSASGYSESNSWSIRIPPDRWIRLRVDVPRDSMTGNAPIFLDPIAKPALIEVVGITLKSKAGKILWRCKPKDFGQVHIPSGVCIPNARALKFVTSDNEARVAFKIPEHCKTEDFLSLEWWQHVTVDSEKLALACRDYRDSFPTSLKSNSPSHRSAPGNAKPGDPAHDSGSGKPGKNSKALRFVQKFLKT